MKPAKLSLFFVVLSLGITVQGFAVSNSKEFNGYQVLRIQIDTPEHLTKIQNFAAQNPSIDFWSEPELQKFCDVMVSPHDLVQVTQFLKTHFMTDVIIADVGRLIKMQNLARDENRAKRQEQDFWSDYQPLDAIFSWMDSLESLHPDFISAHTIGFSHEKRPLRLLKVSKANSTFRPAVFLDSGIHSREWISVSTLTYIVDRLIADQAYADILEALDIHVVPVLNPDGYDYTHTVNRMWRKNRRPTEGTNCVGVDLNRNFPFEWCTVGASNDSCSENYCGSGPGSEPETVVITDYLLQDTINWWGYVTLHSYAQEWCIPWAYTSEHHPDYDAMMAVGRQSVDALESIHGTPYTLKIPSGRYGGFSMDWAKGVRGIKYPVLIELRDTGRYGFLLPPDQIIPSGDETLAAIAAYLRAIILEITNDTK